jgi:hypothetical protein
VIASGEGRHPSSTGTRRSGGSRALHSSPMSSAARISPPPILEKTFVLEFWFEWSQLEASHWRAKVRDEQLDPKGFYRPVATPEDAFKFVRDALGQATPAAYTVGSHLNSGEDCAAAGSKSCPLRRLVRILYATIRRGI